MTSFPLSSVLPPRYSPLFLQYQSLPEVPPPPTQFVVAPPRSFVLAYRALQKHLVK